MTVHVFSNPPKDEGRQARPLLTLGTLDSRTIRAFESACIPVHWTTPDKLMEQISEVAPGVVVLPLSTLSPERTFTLAKQILNTSPNVQIAFLGVIHSEDITHWTYLAETEHIERSCFIGNQTSRLFRLAART